MEKQIGVVVVASDVIVRKTYECPAWYRDMRITPGEYPLYQSDSVRGYSYSPMPGVIVEDYFQSLYCGVRIGDVYDTFQNSGKPDQYCAYFYDNKSDVKGFTIKLFDAIADHKKPA